MLAQIGRILNVLTVGQILYASTDRENTQRFVCWSDPVDQKQMRRMVKTSKRNVGRHDVGPMLPETKKILHEFFRPFIKRLAVLLGDSKFLWNDV